MKKTSRPLSNKEDIGEFFGVAPDGTPVRQHILRNRNGMEVRVIPYGGRIISLKVPDRNGVSGNVVLGFNNLQNYLEEDAYFGALIGRYGNRVSRGKFRLDEQDYQLAVNNEPNHLHGGERGFDKVWWEIVPDLASKALKLYYTSKDMEEGYPGLLRTKVTYKLEEDNALVVSYEAVADKKTIVNLTQHSYFNLSGVFTRQVLDHLVRVEADSFLPVNSDMIPTGEIREVKDTPFDFRKEMCLGAHIYDHDKQLELANGYDHTWIIRKREEGMRLAASAFDPSSGRKLEVYTTEPGMQLYTANWLDGKLPIPETGEKYKKRTGFCFETQHFPNSPNQKEFPSVVLEPGEKYLSKTIFAFSVE